MLTYALVQLLPLVRNMPKKDMIIFIRNNFEGFLKLFIKYFEIFSTFPSSGGEKGRSAFIHNRGIHSLCTVITKQTFQFEDATDLLLSLLGMSGHLCWTYHR